MTEDKQSRIKALFLAYRDSLPSLITELELLWKRLDKKWDEDLAAEFDRKVHGLAGSAATFELALIGDAARELEHSFKPLLEMNTDDARRKSSEQKLIKLKQSIEENLS